MQQFSRFIMKLAETFLLRAHGWTKSIDEFGQAWWFPPDNYMWTKKVNKPHRRGHAVNSLKQALHNPYAGAGKLQGND